MNSTTGIILLLVTLWLLISSPLVEAAAGLTKVFFAYGTLSERMAPLWLADDQGFFKKYGIPTELVFVRGASTLMAGLASGDIHVGAAGGAAALAGAAGGIDATITSILNNRANVEVMVRSGLKTPEDLRGKRFGIQSFGGNTWLFTMLALEQLHLDPTRDNIHLLVIGDQTLLNRALETGTIDALVLTTSVFSRSLKQKGFSSLRELTLPIAGVAIIARKSLIQLQPDTVENLLKAQIEGLAFALSPRYKASVLDTLKKRLRVSSPAFLEEVYNDIVQGLERKPYPSIEGLKNIQRLSKSQNPRLAQLKVEDIVDERFVRKLDESGFIGRLYASYGVK